MHNPGPAGEQRVLLHAAHHDDVLSLGAVRMDPVDTVVLPLLKVHPVDPVVVKVEVHVQDVVAWWDDNNYIFIFKEENL